MFAVAGSFALPWSAEKNFKKLNKSQSKLQQTWLPAHKEGLTLKKILPCFCLSTGR
jgi:hypothetical protein